MGHGYGHDRLAGDLEWTANFVQDQIGLPSIERKDILERIGEPLAQDLGGIGTSIDGEMRLVQLVEAAQLVNPPV